MPGAAGGSRFNELTRLWAAAGHQVDVIAGNLDYQTGQVPAKYAGASLHREQDGDVTVWRCPVSQSYSRSYAGRMAAFAGFAAAATAALFCVGEPDIIIASSPPLVVAIPAWFGSLMRGRRPRIIFEIRDLWPESAVTTGVLRPEGRLTRALYTLERWAYQRADCINVLTPAFRDDLIRRKVADVNKVVCVPNGADLSNFMPGSRDNAIRRDLNWGDRCVVLYAGAHGRANALQQLIEAAAHLRHRPDVLIACVGDGPLRSSLVAEAATRGLTNIVFLGSRRKDEMPQIIQACDVGAAVLQKNSTFLTVYPNKIFDYMACARPVLLGVDGAARSLVCNDAQAGVFAEPENATMLAEKIVWLADHRDACEAMGRRGHQFVAAHANRQVLARRYLDVMDKLMRNTTTRMSQNAAAGMPP